MLDVAAREHERVAPPRRERRAVARGVVVGVGRGARSRRRRVGRWRSCGHLFGAVRSGAVRVRKTSSSVASRRLRSTASMPAASSARITSMRRVPSTTGTVATSSVVVEARWRSTRTAAWRARPRSSSLADATVTSMRSLPMLRLQLVGRAVRDGAPVVEHDDVVGEPVGLFEVLRREDDRGAVADEVAQHVPQLVAAARVETGGRLVEEQHLRARRRGSRRGRAGGACRPRRSSRAASRASVRSSRSSSSSARRARPRPSSRWCSRPTITRFLRRAHQPVDRRLLARRRRCARGRRAGLATTSMPADGRRARRSAWTAW